MIFNVAQLLKEGLGASRAYDLCGELVDIDECNPGPMPIEGTLKLVRTPGGILTTGRVELSLVQPCRRCLRLHEGRVSYEFEEEFVPSIDIETGATLPITDAIEPELLIDEKHQLDLSEVLRQYVISGSLHLGLCRPECKGLCSSCGKDLNLGECACKVDEIDPRLAILSQLLTDDDDNETDSKEP